MPSLPVVTPTVDAILKHQGKYLNSTSDIVVTSNGKRKILLSLITTGASVGIGPGGIADQTIGIGNDSDTNFTGTLLNIPVLKNTVSVKIEGVEKGTDDGAGNITGATISVGTINYSTGAVDVTFTAAPAQDEVISVTYTGFEANLYRNIVGVAPLDLSAFLKNAPFSFFEENMGLIVSPAAGEEITIAYAEIKA